MNAVNYQIAIISAFLWVGFVCAISFMEAWLKFRAPGVTIPIGLGIGRLVFSALNKVEWFFAIVIIISLLLAKQPLISGQHLLYFIPLFLLLLQTSWLLPTLDARAELYIQGKPLTSSNMHLYFVGFEMVKVACLSIFGITLFTKP